MMDREPPYVPAAAGVFALLNRKRRFAYVAYTSSLQKRSHSLAHMLASHDRDPKSYWPIRDLPKHPSDEFSFVVLADAVKPDQSLGAVAVAQKAFAAKSYRIVGGHRAAAPLITFGGRKISLAVAVREHSDVVYITAYRRLMRGWTPRQALGLDPPDPRWHRQKQEERKARAGARA